MSATYEDNNGRSNASTDNEEHRPSATMLKAVQALDLVQHHETIHDPNELIDIGFPAKFLLPLVSIFDSSGRYFYFRQGRLVEEMIGVSHLDLVYSVADYLGVPSEVGLGFTGRGFAMSAKIEAIREILKQGSDSVS